MTKIILDELLMEEFTIKVSGWQFLNERTIDRRMNECNLRKINFTNIPDAGLKEHLNTLPKEFPNCGKKNLHVFFVCFVLFFVNSQHVSY